jgi:hypothetical protein
MRLFNSHVINYSAATGGSSYQYFIHQVGTPLKESISNNNFNNVSIKCSGYIYLINNDYSAPANGSKTIQNNIITTAFQRTAAGTGSFYCYIDNGSSPSTVTHTISGNNFSNITTNTTGSYSFIGIQSTDGSSSNPTLNVYNNTLSNISFNGTSTIYLLYLSYFAGASGSPNLVYGNTISNFSSSSTGTIYGINLGSTGAYVDVYNNAVQNFNLSGTSTFEGIYNGGITTTLNCYHNTITGITNSAAGTIIGIYNYGGATSNYYENYINTFSSVGGVHGFQVNAGTSVNIYNHKLIAGNNYSIYGLSTSGAAVAANGLFIFGGTTVNIHHNNIYNLSNSSAGSTVPLVNGMLLSSGTTINTYNNTIGNLTTPAANYTDAIRGISMTQSSSSTAYNVYFNTVYLAATSSGTNFGTSGIYHVANSTAVYGNLDLRNNIIVNASTYKGSSIPRFKFLPCKLCEHIKQKPLLCRHTISNQCDLSE